MRRYQKKIAREYIELLEQAHSAVRKSLETRDEHTLLDLLGQCQEAAIQLGTMIEAEEGEDCRAVRMLEDYCELVFQIYTLASQKQTLNPAKVHKQLKKQLIPIENNIKQDIRERLEVVFLPYKVSMWDSLESVWMAAREDENCDAYVIPIPYFERNQDRSLGQMHYEGDQYPDYVPVVWYEDYDFQERQPDVVFIHNPYDDFNFVTSVHPFFYSSNLKRFADLLVYIPYYSTAGGMSEGQRQCPAYYHADYIVMQAEKYRKFFDERLPQEKLVALGSPKFDRVIRLCSNPPKPPEAWTEKMAGRKVYFYNTSINGMLGNTEGFLKKMEYVFRCFEGRKDACLLWRPHPLLESTFASMRPQFKPVYDTLKRYFISGGWGIYDDSPDMTDAIVHSDAYIGDSATSVTSLFGIAGKPLFVLNNNIHSAPKEDDWRGEVIRGFFVYGDHRWIVAQGNKLYHSPKDDFQYEYCCDLSEYARGDYYMWTVTVNGNSYVCPTNAHDIVEVNAQGIKRRILLEDRLEQPGAFYGFIGCDNYLFLIPNYYPAIVRYDTVKDTVKYIEGSQDVFVFAGTASNGERHFGGYCAWDGKLYLASPLDNRILVIHAETGEQQIVSLEADGVKGFCTLACDGVDIWCLPYEGKTIVRWNPQTGEQREYADLPEGLTCWHPIQKYECMTVPFGRAVFYQDQVFFSPAWGNLFVRLDKESGKMTEWKPPFPILEKEKNSYYTMGGMANFINPKKDIEQREPLVFTLYDRKLYKVDLETNEWQELRIGFDRKELEKSEAGFQKESQWMQYCCLENAFNSLPDFLDGNITGHAFDRQSQLDAYSLIAANHDGTSGEKIYGFVKEKLGRKPT